MNENQDKGVKKSGINWYPGHMAKTKREISEKLSLIDVVFEVIDARIPMSSKNKDIDTLIKDKPKVLIMTKIDLCDMEKTNKWKSYYENDGYQVIMVDLINNNNVNEIFNKINPVINDLNEKRKNKGLKPRKIRALVLGIPNVGKSTLINRLVGKKATNVGNKPGITKNLEWIRVNDKLELLDTPGILWPRLDNNEIAHNLASMTAIKEEVLDLEDISIYIIDTMFKYYPDSIKVRYNITNNDDIVETLNLIGKKIGAVKNGETDYDKVYVTILKDLREGRLGRITFDNIKKSNCLIFSCFI